MTGLQVTEVNVAIADIFLPNQDDEDTDEQQPPRVQ
jgi:uncharacterized alkaline shock family protein YloU